MHGIEILDVTEHSIIFTFNDNKFMIKGLCESDEDEFEDDIFESAYDFHGYLYCETLYIYKEIDGKGFYKPCSAGFDYFSVFNWLDYHRFLEDKTFDYEKFVYRLISNDFADYIGLPEREVKRITNKIHIDDCEQRIRELELELNGELHDLRMLLKERDMLST